MKQEIPQGFYFRDTDHSYFLNGKRMTGCTTILGIIAKPALIGWAARMAVEYVEQAVNSEDFKIEDMPDILTEAAKAHTKKKDAGAEKGTDVHALAEEYIKSCIAQGGDARSAGAGDAQKEIGKFVEWAQTNNIKFLASEARLYSESMFVAGTADIIFEKDGKRYVGDIKTYKKLWDRTPMLQCAGYGIMAEEMGEPKFDGYCILRLSENGEFEEKWSYDVEGDTKGFKAAVELYRTLANWK